MQSGIGRRRAATLAEGGAAFAERRAENIATAARIFREKGFRGASLADVAESLGTDRASLYYYIGSKEELFHEIVRDAAEANAEQAEAIRDGAGTAVDKLGILITALMASYSAHYPYLFVYIQEDLSKVADGRFTWARQMTVIKSGTTTRSSGSLSRVSRTARSGRWGRPRLSPTASSAWSTGPPLVPREPVACRPRPRSAGRSPRWS